MKLLYTTDLHGSKWKYSRLLKEAKHRDVDAVINGGDMLPKGGDLFAQGKFITEFLDLHFLEYNCAGIHHMGYLGNDDLMIFDGLFRKTCGKYPHLHDLAQKKHDLDGYEFLAMNWVVDYPFRLKDRCRKDTDAYEFQEQFGTGLLSRSEGWKELDDWFGYADRLPTIADELKQLPVPNAYGKTICVFHMPPSGLDLDVCLDGQKVGSQAIYDFIKDKQPRLTLHGHIHESPMVSGKWHSRLGKTLCMQPGQMDRLSCVIIDLDSLDFERLLLKQ